MERAVRVVVSGRVQGVFFRQYTLERARELGLRGYVRNLPDNTIEAVAIGPEDDIETFIAFLRKGSPASRVDDVRISELSAAEVEDISGFQTLL